MPLDFPPSKPMLKRVGSFNATVFRSIHLQSCYSGIPIYPQHDATAMFFVLFYEDIAVVWMSAQSNHLIIRSINQLIKSLKEEESGDELSSEEQANFSSLLTMPTALQTNVLSVIYPIPAVIDSHNSTTEIWKYQPNLSV